MKSFCLVDAQSSRNLELYVAFRGNDNEDQIVCPLTLKQVVSIYTYYFNLWGNSIKIDQDVLDYLDRNNFLKNCDL